MDFHFQTDKCEESIAGSLPGKDLHGFGSALEFLVDPLDDVGRPEADPLLLREIQVRKTGLQDIL